VIDLYTAPTPNGWKASIMLEGLENLERWVAAVGDRPAVQRGRAVPAPPESDETPKPDEIEKTARKMLA
jgi:GST-like protein